MDKLKREMRAMQQAHEKWRRKAAKRLKCSPEAIDEAVKEGLAILKKMRENGNPLADGYGHMTAASAGLICYMYASNPTLRTLMENFHADHKDHRVQ